MKDAAMPINPFTPEESSEATSWLRELLGRREFKEIFQLDEPQETTS
jgi:hypothetical protein